MGIYDEKKAPFEEYAKKYLDFSMANKAWSTYQRRDRHSVSNPLSFFKGKYLFEITPEMIEKYKAARLEKVTPASVDRELACLKHMYAKAMEWGYAKMNPAKGVKRLNEAPGRLRYLSPERAGQLLEVCSGHLTPIVVNESGVIPINQTLYQELLALSPNP